MDNAHSIVRASLPLIFIAGSTGFEEIVLTPIAK
jgi:hypothetical protein